MQVPEASSRRVLAKILLLTMAYVVVGRLALLLAIPPGFATAIFPPVGMGLVAILLWGYPLIAGVFLGSTLLNLSIAWSNNQSFSTTSLVVAMAIALGSSLQNALGSGLIKRFVQPSTTLSHERDVFLFLILGGPLACLLSATWSVSTLFLAGIIDLSQYWFSWFTWWVGDSIGVLIAAPLMMIAFASPRDIWWGRRFTVGMPYVLTSSLMMLIFMRSSVVEQESVRAAFHEQAKLMTASIRFHLLSYSKLSRELERFLVAAPNATRNDFRLFATDLQDRYAGVHATSWNVRIARDERAAFEQAVSSDGFAGFTLTERDDAKRLVPAKTRDEYVAIKYIEPLSTNARAVGFDVASDPVRRLALEYAHTHDEPAMTAPVDLVQADGTIRGALLMYPVYEVSRDDRVKHFDKLRGYATIVLRLDNIISAALSSYSPTDFHLTLEDISDLSAPSIVAGEAKYDVPAYAKPLVFGNEWNVAGRTWRITVSPSAEFLRANRSLQPWAVLAGGLTLCALLGAFLLVVSGRTNHVQKLVEQRTAELSAILDHAAEAILTCDATGHIERANPATATLFDYPPSELQTLHMGKLLPGIDFLRGSTLGHPREIVTSRRDGSLLSLEMSVSRMEIHGRIVYTCMLHDISARKKSEQLKNEFISTVSHELRTPLTSISGSLGLILGGVMGDVNPDVREMVDIAKVNAERLTGLVNDILDIDKLESGHLELHCSEQDLKTIVRDSIAEMTGYAERHGVLLELRDNSKDDVPVLVHVDKPRVFQVLANLISNAAKFSPRGENVTVSLDVSGGRAKVTVQDRGPGVPEEFRNRIFQKFAQADGADSRQRGGTGLGLSISKAIIERMNGSIGFESTVGKGSSFYFTLPLV